MTFQKLLETPVAELKNHQLQLHVSELDVLKSIFASEVARCRTYGMAASNRIDRDRAILSGCLGNASARVGAQWDTVGERLREARDTARIYIAGLQHVRALIAAIEARVPEKRWPNPTMMQPEPAVIFRPATPAFVLQDWCNERAARLLVAVRISGDGRGLEGIRTEFSEDEWSVLRQNERGIIGWLNGRWEPVASEAEGFMHWRSTTPALRPVAEPGED